MKIEFNEPTMPKGMLFHVNALGALENGKSVDFSAEEVATFEAAQGRTIQEAFKDSPNVKILGSASKGGDDS